MRRAQKGDSERGSWPFERWVLDQDPSPGQRCWPPDEDRDHARARFRLPHFAQAGPDDPSATGYRSGASV
uniref:Uncharacterized protein n=1 Tax=Paracoccus methylutens TaxID=135742 RepID=Q7WTS2_9RHOB|nr:unknown [Paracoccus methylutens]